MQIKTFCFNPFSENTYIIFNEAGSSWIVDPGCSDQSEEKELLDFIGDHKLRLEALLLTHAHIDHILGNDFIYREFGLKPIMHSNELGLLRSAAALAQMYGIPYSKSEEPERFLEDKEVLKLGDQNWECILCPGHSPGSICFYNKTEEVLIGGDVLFNGSIGRTDLPGGDHDGLLRNIRNRLFVLDPKTIVLPGHGEPTTIRHEMETNPFF